MSPSPEREARQHIDAALEAAGWAIQDRDTMNLVAAPGVAVREFKMAKGHGFADYLLFVNGKAVGALEAKPAGYRLANVELQAGKYATGLPDGLNPPVNPLPFLYLSTGVETRFINGLDPDPKTRAISANLSHIHRPETLAEWIAAETLDEWVKRLHAEGTGFHTAADDTRPASFRARLGTMPPLEPGTLYPNQVEAVTNLEQSLRRNRPRALIKMATCSGDSATIAQSPLSRLLGRSQRFTTARTVPLGWAMNESPPQPVVSMLQPLMFAWQSNPCFPGMHPDPHPDSPQTCVHASVHALEPPGATSATIALAATARITFMVFLLQR